MSLQGVVHEFSDFATGANDLSVEVALTNRPSDFRVVFYKRTNTDLITLSLALQVQGYPDFLIREIVDFAGTSWFFSESFPMTTRDKLIFTTSGAVAGEDHAVLVRLEEMRL